MTYQPTIPPERRKHPRYFVTARMTMAIEDESLKESLGLGEPDDISLGGVRVRNLPACANVNVGDRLALVIIDREDALAMHGEVVHLGTPDTFGVEFLNLTANSQLALRELISRLHIVSQEQL